MQLKEYRMKHDLSQYQFAVLAGIYPGTVSNIERGAGCTVETARKILAASNGEITLDDLPPTSEAEVEQESSSAQKDPSGAGA